MKTTGLNDSSADLDAQLDVGMIPQDPGTQANPEISGSGSAQAESLPAPGLAAISTAEAPQPARTEIVFVMNDVADYQTLLNGVKPGTEVHVLDASGDGLAQMAAILAGRSGVDAIHIVSHGAPGSLQLGSLTLAAQNLPDNAAALVEIGGSLAADGDILLYGCNVAQGEAGADFVNQFATATGADVAASDDLTGSSWQGGDWVLEYASSSIDPASSAVSDALNVAWAGTILSAIAPAPIGASPAIGATDSSSPANLININGTLYFAADDGTSGIELWKSDGTEAGTVRVKDIYTGANNSGPTSLTNINGTLYFKANDGSSGTELWKSDGTEAGTVRVKDINAGSGNSGPGNLTPINGTLYFTAYDGSSGIELWKSDGTEAGTVRVKDIVASSGSSDPGYFANFNGTLYFRATDATGTELWKSDGTETGTVQVKDINPGSESSNPYYLTDINGTAYFAASDGTSGFELWKTDGTEAGTVQVKDINAGSGHSTPDKLININGTLYFTADDGTSGIELWKSDGTEAGTVRVKDINAGAGNSGPGNLTPINGTLYFTAYDGSSGIELWKSDGTEAGTVRVKDINAGSANSNPANLTNSNGTLYFTADDGTSGTELWKTDGTEAGTVRVKDINAGSANSSPSILTNINGTLFFKATDVMGGAELWKTDGTEAGTTRVVDLNRIYTPPLTSLTVGGNYYFVGYDAAGGTELWKSDGTEAGTVRVKDINAGSANSSPSILTNINGTLFFKATDATGGTELWKSDGTEAGTIRVKDINAGSANSSPANLTNSNGTLYFTANDGTSGTELWKSDGTEAGTVRVKDIVAGSGSSSPQLLTDVGGTLYFKAIDANGFELWKSDGTEAGTVRVKDIVAGAASSNPANLTNINGTLYFTANDGTSGIELWKSDGTGAGTVRVKDINGSGSSNPTNLTNSNGTLYFIATDGTSGIELWKTDGTAAGTVRVKDINPGSLNSNTANLTDISGTLYFIATDGTSGIELWKSDGTEAGTVRVKDINAGSGNSGLGNLTPINGTLYFTANDGTSGVELWKSDGTEAGTVRVKDIYAGSNSSSPANLTNIDGTLYFTATDAAGGTELWTSDGTEAGTVRVDLSSGPYSSYPSRIAKVGDKVFFYAFDDVSNKVSLFAASLSTNTAPTVGGVPGDLTVTEDTVSNFDLSDVIVADADGNNLIVTLAASAGTFTASSSGNITVGGSGTSTLTLSGAAADINAWLDTASHIQYTGSSNANGNDAATFTLKANDGTVDSSIANGNIDISETNDAPTLTPATPMLTGITEDDTSNAGQTVASLLGTTITDPDTGALKGIAVYGASDTNGSWEFNLNDGSGWQSIGTVDTSGALLLRHTDQLRFVPDASNDITATIDYYAWDQTGSTTAQQGTKVDVSSRGGSTPFSQTGDTASITTTDVNDAPVLFGNSYTFNSTNEDTPSSSVLVSDILDGASWDDVDEGSSRGIAVTSITKVSGGAWQFLVAGGSTWTDFGSVSSTQALLLASNTQVRYVPDGNNGETATFDFRAWDQTGGTTASTDGSAHLADTTTSGGATAFSSNTATASLTVSGLNDAPTLNNGTAHVLSATDEDTTSSGTAVSAILTAGGRADVDSGALAGMAVTAKTGNGTWQYSTDGTSWQDFGTVSAGSALLLDGASQVRYVPDSIDGETATFTYRTWDQTSGTASTNGTAQTADTTTNGGATAFSTNTGTASLTVGAINDAPSFTGGATLAAVPEDSASPSGKSVSSLFAGLFSDSGDVVVGGSSGNTLAGIAIAGDNSTAGQGTWEYSTDGTSWYSVGSVAADSALLLETTARLRFVPASDFNGAPGALTVFAVDNSGTTAWTSGNTRSTFDTTTDDGTSPVSAAGVALNTNITAVNDSPSFSGNATLGTVSEDAAAPAGDTVANLFGSLFNDSRDAVSGGSSAHGLAGIAIAGNAATSGEGVWQYSTDSGASWLDVGSVSSHQALILDSSSLLRFLPAADFDDTPGNLTVHAMDDGLTVTPTMGAVRSSVDLANANLSGAPFSPAAITVHGSTYGGGISKPVVAMDSNGDRIVMAWTDITAAGKADIYARVLNDNGTFATGTITVATNVPFADGETVNIDAAIDATGRFAVAYDHLPNGSGQADIGIQRYEANGTAFGSLYTQGLANRLELNPALDLSASGRPVLAYDQIATTTTPQTHRLTVTAYASFDNLASNTTTSISSVGGMITPDVNFNDGGSYLLTGTTAAGSAPLRWFTPLGNLSLSSTVSSLLGPAISEWIPGSNDVRIIYAQSVGGQNTLITRLVSPGATQSTAPVLGSAETLASDVQAGDKYGLEVLSDGSRVVLYRDTTGHLHADLFNAAGVQLTTWSLSTLGVSDSYALGRGAANWAAFLTQTNSPATLATPVDFSLNLAAFGQASNQFATTGVSLSTSISAANDAPTLSAGTIHTLSSTDEDTTSAGTAVSAILSTGGQTDVDSGALTGMAITAATGNGTWQYSTDGTTWQDFGTVSAVSALLLNDTTQVRYVPDGEDGETATFTYRAWDQSSGTASTNSTPQTADTTTNGGTTAFSSNTGDASLTVGAANDAPIDIALSAASLSIYAGFNATVGTLTTTDVDPADTHTYALVSGSGDTDNGLFNISGGILRANDASALSVGTYTVRIRSTDSGSSALSYEESFTITVSDTLIVTTNSDSGSDATIDGSYALDAIDGGGLSLRETLNYASGGGKTIGFAAGLSGQTISLGSGVSVAAGTVLDTDAAGTLTIDGFSLTLPGSLEVISGSGGRATINSAMTGTGDLTLSGAGSLKLDSISNNSGWSGAISVTAGTLIADSGSRLSSGALTLDGGTLGMTVTGTPGTTTVANSVTLGAGGGTISIGGGGGANIADFSGVISGSGDLNKTAAAILKLSGNNTYSGTTTVSAGTLSISSDSNLGGGNLTLAGGTTLAVTGATTVDNGIALSGDATIDSSASVTLSGVIGGAGGFTKAGSSTLTLSGTNTYAGTTTISAGTLSIAGAGNISGAALTLDGGTLAVTGAATLANAITLGASDGTVNNSAAVTLSGDITGSGNFAKTGAGTLTLSGTNTYIGTTTISGGTVNVSSDSNLGAGAVTLNVNGWLSVVGTTAIDNNIILNAASAVINIAGGETATLTGVISETGGGSRGLNKSGSGTLVIGSNATYTGATNLNGGVFQLAAGTTLATSSITLNNSSPTLKLTGAGTFATPIIVRGNGTNTISADDAVTLSGVVSLSGDASSNRSLTKSGTGTLTLSNSGNAAATLVGGTHTLGLTVTAGAVSVAGDANLVAGAVTLSGGGTLAVSGVTTIDNAFILSGTGGTLNAAADTTLSGAISGAGELTKIGGGTLTLSGANTYTGATTITAGALVIGGDGNLGTGDVTLAVGTTLQVTGATTLDNAVALSGAATLQTDAAVTLSGTLIGPADLTKTGAGTLTLTNTGNEAGMSGGVTVASSTLAVADDDVLPGGTVTLASGTTLQVTGATAIDNAVALSGAATIRTDSAVTLSGALTGGADLTKTGAGTLTLSGTNSFGAINVAAGNLSIASDSNLGSGNVTLTGGWLFVTQNATIDNNVTLNQSTSVIDVASGMTATLTGAVSETGGVRNLNKSGSGKLEYAGPVTYTGNTVLNGGTLQVSAGATFNSASVMINNSLPTFAVAGTGTFTAPIHVRNSGTITNAGGCDPVGADIERCGGQRHSDQIRRRKP